MLKAEIARRMLALRGTLTREEVAAALGIGVSTLQMYENGNRIPRDDLKVRIAAYYGTTVQQLFYDAETYEGLSPNDIGCPTAGRKGAT